MADDASKTKGKRDQEAREAVTSNIINNPDMAVAVQSTGRSSQRKREENRKAREERPDQRETGIVIISTVTCLYTQNLGTGWKLDLTRCGFNFSA